ncbi:hypothetical protein T07_14463 [Trichinella nelsoni]|uniref:Uncharacterized protein n=1 Tax=Trichinella nelsoni TaxID=6336 RepID=A0A0V0S863_9BILA|nr:hypothetical protein T07_14463 [Trichinella nelsoni]
MQQRLQKCFATEFLPEISTNRNDVETTTKKYRQALKIFPAKETRPPTYIMSKSGQCSAESPPPYPGNSIPVSLPVVHCTNDASAAQQKSRPDLTTVNVMKSCRTNNATTVKVCPQCQMPLVNVDNSKRFILIVLLMIITFPISLVYLCCMPPLKNSVCF